MSKTFPNHHQLEVGNHAKAHIRAHHVLSQLLEHILSHPLLLCRSVQTMVKEELGTLATARSAVAHSKLLLCRLVHTTGLGAPGEHSHCSVDRCPDSAAAVQVCSNHAGRRTWRLSHCRPCR
ncbi:hypothetical protein ABBQ32_008380 [Trebouxia sp. C0010 RCD-2024]